MVTSYRPVAYVVFLMLLSSVIALLYAPLIMPVSYDWISHTTSESGAQGIEGAWLSRLGFLIYGFSVLLLVMALRHIWGRGAVVLHACFGVFMAGNAAFSSRPWLLDLPFDPIEDHLHSFMSDGVGFAFTLGVLVVFLQRSQSDRVAKAFDVIVMLCSIFIPLAMLVWLNIDGLIQRIMFAVSYVWYAKETARILEIK